MSLSVPVEASRRIDVFDGIRGIAILLVVLNHGFVLWPTDYIFSHSVTTALFRSGDFAVSIFFVVGSFLATRGLLRLAASRRGLRPDVAFVRRLLRLGGQLYFLLLVVALVSVFDSTDNNPQSQTRISILRTASFSWNWYVRKNVYSRSDLGHLWYLSVDLQVFAIILCLVYLLRRRPHWLLFTLLVLIAFSTWWGWHTLRLEGEYSALLRTFSRMSAPLIGAAVAVALPYLGGLKPYARTLALVSFYSLVPLAYFVWRTSAFFSWQGALLNLALATFVASCVLAPAPRAVAAPLSLPPLTFLGRRSLALYLWHYPVMFFVLRHSFDWRWQARTILALLITFAIAEVSHRFVEPRVRKALDSPAWVETDDGLTTYLWRRTKRTVSANDA